MGILNLLAGKYDGKVGQTVGAKWKDKATIRTYAVPSNPNTENQQVVRRGFGEINSYVSRFADGIKYLTALDTSGMSARNAIVKINKSVMDSGDFDKTELIVSKGGLPKPLNVATSFVASTGGKVSLTWDVPTASNLSESAKVVIICVDATNDLYEVGEPLLSAKTWTGTIEFPASENFAIYVYTLDTHGSSKVASISQYVAA